jgi:hypothetical protein|tara:strand:- start:259 stop:1521 length:1263 start_codon:yes stop_codon:yes gene_type:complete
MLSIDLWFDPQSNIYDELSFKQPKHIWTSRNPRAEINWELKEQLNYTNFSINYKSIQDDDLNLNNKNYIIFPWVILFRFEHININEWLEKYFTRKIIKFIKIHRIEVVFIWMYEAIDWRDFKVNSIIKFFNKHKIKSFLRFADNRFSLDDIDPDIRKFWTLPLSKNRMLPRYNWAVEVTHKDTFVLENPEKFKKICYVVGRAASNNLRILSLLKAHEKNILDNDDIFFTFTSGMESVSEEELLEWIKNRKIHFKSYEHIFNDDEKIKEIFKTRVVDKYGNVSNKTREEKDQYYSFPQTHYALVNVVIETREYELSLTEKTLKCLKHGLPFIPYASQGSIKHLKEQGYKFYDWIDYSYDSIKSPYERFDAFFNEVYRLYKMPMEDLIKLYRDKKTIHINEYNKYIYQKSVVEHIEKNHILW